MQMTIDLPTDLAAELIENEAMAIALGRENLTISKMIEQKLRGDNNGVTTFWSTIWSGDRNIRVPKLSQKHQECETNYIHRCLELIAKVEYAIQESALPSNAIGVLAAGYGAVTEFYRARLKELNQDRLNKEAVAKEVAIQEAEARKKAQEAREIKAKAPSKNLNMPFDALRNLPAEDDLSEVLTVEETEEILANLNEPIGRKK